MTPLDNIPLELRELADELPEHGELLRAAATMIRRYWAMCVLMRTTLEEMGHAGT